MKLNTCLVPCVTLLASLVCMSACGKQESAPAPAPSSPSPAAESHGHGHGGAVVELGTSVIGPFNVKVTRDEGAIMAGRDAAIDAIVTPTTSSDAKASVVRFWIGTQDAAGSVKARADIENPAEPNRWHTHAEIPDPVPAGAKLWVEIEDAQGNTVAGGFDLQ